MNKYFVLILIIFTSCTSNVSDSEFYNHSPSSLSDIVFEEVDMETIVMDSILSSFGGQLIVTEEGLSFIDYNFGWMFNFDLEGSFLDRSLGVGQGPKEIPASGITFYTPIHDRGHLFIGSSFDFYTFDNELERQQTGRIRFKQDKPTEYLAGNPTPEDQRSYNLAYYISDAKATGTHAFLPLIGGPPEYTSFSMDTDLFAKEARLLARMNLETGEIEDIIGRFPPSYYEHPEKRPLSYFFFDLIDNETIAITFAADPFIHLFTLDFEHLSSFGIEGHEMDTNYELFTGSAASFERFIVNQMRTKGFYNSIKYIPETGLLFRGYSKGTDSDIDGMQVYKNNTLVAHFDVPKGMRIAGYAAPWYYSDADVDERNEIIKTHRFKLEL